MLRYRRAFFQANIRTLGANRWNISDRPIGTNPHRAANPDSLGAVQGVAEVQTGVRGGLPVSTAITFSAASLAIASRARAVAEPM